MSVQLDISDYIAKKFLINFKNYQKTPEVTERYNKMVELEDELMTRNRICRTNGGEHSLLGISISDVDKTNLNKIVNYIKTHHYDRNAMEVFRCMINTIIDIEDKDGNSERERINQFITGLKVIGGVSASFGVPILGTLRTTQTYRQLKTNLFVIKCPQEPINSAELIHELCIGLCGLNELRGRSEDGLEAPIPFFAYVFDAFYCSKPVVEDKTKEVLEWCSSGNNPVSNVLYENIDDSFPINKMVNKTGTKALSDMFLTIINIAIGLHYAEEKLEFTHGDLHDENILMQETLKTDMVIELPFEGYNLYFLSPPYIPKIIDFGTSRLKTKTGEVIYRPDYSGFRTAIEMPWDEPNAIADMHKLICFLLKTAINKNNTRMKVLLKGILHYFYSKFYKTLEDFTEDVLEKILLDQFESRYHIPKEVVTQMGINLHNFIHFLSRAYKYEFGFCPFASNKEELKELSKNFSEKFGVIFDKDIIPIMGEEIGTNDSEISVEELAPMLVSTPTSSSKKHKVNDDTGKVELNTNVENIVIPSFYSIKMNPTTNDIVLLNNNLEYIVEREKTELNSCLIKNVHITFFNTPNSLDSLLLEKTVVDIATKMGQIPKITSKLNTYHSIYSIISGDAKSLFSTENYATLVREINLMIKICSSKLHEYHEQLTRIQKGVDDIYKMLSLEIFKIMVNKMDDYQINVLSESKYGKIMLKIETLKFNIDEFLKTKIE